MPRPFRALALSAFAYGALFAAGLRPSDSGKPRVAFVTNNPEEFWTIARLGTDKAAKEFNVEVDFKMPARGSAGEQRQIVEDLMIRGIKGLAVSPNDAANQAEFYNKIGDRIPLLTQDSDLPAGSKRLCYLGTNNYEAGKSAGKMLKEALPAGGTFVIFVGKLDAENARQRRQGVIDELAGAKDVDGKYPLTLGKFTLLDTMTDQPEGKSKCKQNAADAMVRYPDLNAMVGLWAYNPPGCLLAVKDAKKEGKVIIVGFDEDEATLEGIKAGSVYGTVVQQPYEFGYESIRILAKLAQGDKTVLPEGGVKFIPHKEIRKDNVEAFHAELKQLKAGVAPVAAKP